MQVIVTCLFVSVLALYFALIYKTKSILGFYFAIVVGSSMYPTLYDGDFLVINQNADYEINDIVCFFDEENRRIVHRIINIEGNDIITKGDFNSFEDLPISTNKIVGKVVFKSTLLGYIFRNVHIIIFVFILIILLKLKNFEKYDKIKL